jgi:hypothetical protein
MPNGNGSDIELESLSAGHRYHLLVIGIEYYAHFTQLPNAVLDAAQIADLLTDKYNFDRPENFDTLQQTDNRYQNPAFNSPLPVFNSQFTTCLYNEAAKKNDITKKLDEYAGITGNNKLGEFDALVIYFAGHGIFKNDTYYLIAQDSNKNDPGSFITVDEIAMRFKNYPTQKHSQHVLLILDSCYAGGANLGLTAGLAAMGTFTRQVLTSCTNEQPANDGVIYRGSAFARSLQSALQQNQSPLTSIDALVLAQRVQFESDETKSSDFQTIELANLPGALIGRGTFPFQRRNTEKPDIDHLRESIIDHLDFHHQRGDLQNFYDDALNQLNIITTQGNNIRAHRVLSKVILKWLNAADGIDFVPGLCYVPTPINLDMHGDEEIFEILNKGLKTPDKEYDPPMILKWFLDQMKTTNADWYCKRHIILRIDFTGSPEKRVKQIEQFCTKFSAMFLDYFEQLPENEKLQYGKMFVLISDVSSNGLDPHIQIFSSIVGNDKYNFIPIQKNSNINGNHIKTWLKEFSKKNQSEKVKSLGEEKLFKNWVGKNEYEYEKFIEKFCSYCGFTQQEMDALNAQLYDYNNKFLI